MVGVYANLVSIVLDHLIHGIGMQRFGERFGIVVPDRPEEGTVLVATVAGMLKVFMYEALGPGMDWNIADLAAFSVDAEVNDIAAPMVVADSKRAEFLSS